KASARKLLIIAPRRVPHPLHPPSSEGWEIECNDSKLNTGNDSTLRIRSRAPKRLGSDTLLNSLAIKFGLPPPESELRIVRAMSSEPASKLLSQRLRCATRVRSSETFPMTQEKILIVEDEENERTGLAELVRAWGYEAETANDGVEGLQAVEVWNPGI